MNSNGRDFNISFRYLFFPSPSYYFILLPTNYFLMMKCYDCGNEFFLTFYCITDESQGIGRRANFKCGLEPKKIDDFLAIFCPYRTIFRFLFFVSCWTFIVFPIRPPTLFPLEFKWKYIFRPKNKKKVV